MYVLFYLARHLESEYLSWLNKLDRKSASFEENLDMGELNFPEVIHKFRTIEKETRQKRIRERWETDRRAKRRKGDKKTTYPPPYLSRSWTVMDGIPHETTPQEYIKYRKCLYMDTIREWREEMSSALSPPVLDELQQLLTRLFR
jgi:hypothetical protein